MDENMVMDETIDETITSDEFDESSEGSSLISKVIVGGATIAAGAAIGFTVKNRAKIAAKFSEIKENRRQKLVKKTMDRLAKLEAKAPKSEEAEKEE